MLFLLTTLIAFAAPELCNGVDDNGDGHVDEGPVWASVDLDGDGFGSPTDAIVVQSCSDLAPDEVSDASDPDDNDPLIFPGAAERCNGLDDDGDGELDEEACGCESVVYEPDIYQMCTDPLPWAEANVACTSAGYHVATARTADEQTTLEDAIAPYGVEFWMGLTDLAVEGTFTWSQGSALTYTHWRASEPNNFYGNEDCAEMEPGGLWDDNDCSTPQAYVCEINCAVLSFYTDADGDGLGDPDAPVEACVQPAGTVRNHADCDDSDGEFPGLFFVDADLDGFGTQEVVLACASKGVSSADGDCDDTNAAVSPGGIELADDGIDSDCDGIDPSSDEPDVEPQDEPEDPSDPAPGRQGGIGLNEPGATNASSNDPAQDPRAEPANPHDDRDYGFGVGCNTAPQASLLGLLGLLALRRRRS